MGAKDWMLFYADGEIRPILQSTQPEPNAIHRGAGQDLAQFAHPAPRVRGALGWPFGLQLPDHFQRVVDVLADVSHGIEDVPDRALAVDDIGDAAG
jgi:hypothetical protein